MTGSGTCPLHLGSHNSHEAIDHSSPVAEMREVRTNTTINSCSGSYNDQQSRTARSQLLGSPTLSLPPDTTPGEWTASAQSAKPSTGSVCTFRRLGVSILTRCFVWDGKTSSAVAMEVYSYLHPHEAPPDGLRRSLSASTPDTRNFRENIRQYNSALAFTSLGAQIDDSVNRGGGGPPVFRIQGKPHHQISSLLPPDGQRPGYARLYILDSHEAHGHRMQRNSGLDPNVMYRLGGLITQYYRWAEIFKQAHEVSQRSNTDEVSLQLTVDRNRDRRRHNLPTSNEAAVVVPGDGIKANCSRDIVLHRKDGFLQRVNEGSAMYERFQYPLFFSTAKMVITTISQCPPPATSDSPEPIIPHIASNDAITRSHYYSAVAVYSSNTWSICGPLTKAASIISATTSRTSGASLHSGLADAVDNRVDLHNVGQRFVLPSSYTGGPR